MMAYLAETFFELMLEKQLCVTEFTVLLIIRNTMGTSLLEIML